MRGNFDQFLADRKAGQPWHYFFGVATTHRTWIKGSGKVLWGIEPDKLKGRMPAFLPEPLFVSDETLATIAQSEAGQEKVAQVLVETIVEHFPNGARVAFSCGHLFKVSSPHDRGAAVAGTGGKVGEGDLALAVLVRAERMLMDLNRKREDGAAQT